MLSESEEEEEEEEEESPVFFFQLPLKVVGVSIPPGSLPSMLIEMSSFSLSSFLPFIFFFGALKSSLSH